MKQATESKKILVVDDQETVCESVRTILSRKGHEVEGALSADEALEKLDRCEFDLVVTDLMMPGKSGMDLLREARGKHDAVPFVVITGYASIPSAVEAAKLGVSSYLSKPFTPDELTEVTDKALAEKIPFPTFGGRVDEDLPFQRGDLSGTAEEYPDRMTRSGIALLSERFCPVGKMECKKYERSGACSGICVILAKRARTSAAIHLSDYVEDALDEDLPFNRAELAAATCPSYVDALGSGGMPRGGHWQSARMGKRVLVIDSDPEASNRIRASLSRSGYTVDQAFDAEAGRALVATGRFDLVITEQNLTGSDGIALTRELKAARPDVGVVMVSSYASIEGAVQAIQAGALEYSERPQKDEEIRELADKALQAVGH